MTKAVRIELEVMRQSQQPTMKKEISERTIGISIFSLMIIVGIALVKMNVIPLY